jgi:hypothetical protein
MCWWIAGDTNWAVIFSMTNENDDEFVSAREFGSQGTDCTDKLINKDAGFLNTDIGGRAWKEELFKHDSVASRVPE